MSVLNKIAKCSRKNTSDRSKRPGKMTLVGEPHPASPRSVLPATP